MGLLNKTAIRGVEHVFRGQRLRRLVLLSIIPVYLAHRLTREGEGVSGGRGAGAVAAGGATTI